MRQLSTVTLVALFATPSLTLQASGAEFIQQPASILPWQAAVATQNQPQTSAPELAPLNQRPSWLLTPSAASSQHLTPESHLPMVESESYSEIGTLRVTPDTNRGMPTARQRTGNTNAARPFSLMRALGFQGRQSKSR